MTKVTGPDAAMENFPSFRGLSIDQARTTFCKWIDDTWDFTKKSEMHKLSVMTVDTVAGVQQFAMNAALKGMSYKKFNKT
jgi:hypothetical protein